MISFNEWDCTTCKYNGKSNLSEWCHCGFCVRRFAPRYIYIIFYFSVAGGHDTDFSEHYRSRNYKYITTTILQSPPCISIMLLPIMGKMIVLLL